MSDTFIYCISIHAPPRGATYKVHFQRKRQAFQFTPLREGRQIHTPLDKIPIQISIHAPPRGATVIAWVNGGLSGLISIHAPPRGATLLALTCLPMAFYFNSRPSARGDLPRASRCAQAAPISIHAPPRGATVSQMRPNLLDDISIHAPPRGATRRKRREVRQDGISIHAPPRGATLVAQG